MGAITKLSNHSDASCPALKRWRSNATFQRVLGLTLKATLLSADRGFDMLSLWKIISDPSSTWLDVATRQKLAMATLSRGLPKRDKASLAICVLATGALLDCCRSLHKDPSVAVDTSVGVPPHRKFLYTQCVH